MSTHLCRYKHALGEERKGFHRWRLFDVAVGDVLLTVLGAYFIARAFQASFLATLIVVLVLGIVMHRLFCVNTKVNVMLFGKI